MGEPVMGNCLLFATIWDCCHHRLRRYGHHIRYPWGDHQQIPGVFLRHINPSSSGQVLLLRVFLTIYPGITTRSDKLVTELPVLSVFNYLLRLKKGLFPSHSGHTSNFQWVGLGCSMLSKLLMKRRSKEHNYLILEATFEAVQSTQDNEISQ